MFSLETKTGLVKTFFNSFKTESGTTSPCFNLDSITRSSLNNLF